MNWRISLLILSIGLSLFSCDRTSSPEATPEKEEYYSVDCLIEAEDLMLHSGSYKLIDLRKPDEFKTGHIPKALNVWRNQITDTSFSYGGMMPSKTHLETLLGSLGISPQDTIVIYDDKAECDAARLWWLLKFYGHKHPKLLNGGLTAWKSAGGKLSLSEPKSSKSNYAFKNSNDSSIYASISEVEKLQFDSLSILLDTRSEQEFSGTVQKNGAAAAGHIEQAMNIDWAAAVDFNGDKKFRSTDELLKIYSKAGINGDSPVIIYCHTGVRSAHTLFVLTELLGYRNIKNYDGSWTEWSHLKAN